MLNKTMLIGNLGADVDIRYTKSQVAVATFRIATTERWKDNEGKPQESTEWHRIVAFGRLAEICCVFRRKWATNSALNWTTGSGVNWGTGRSEATLESFCKLTVSFGQA